MAALASNAYHAQINNGRVARHFSARIEAFFDGNEAAPTIIGADSLADYTLLREMAAEANFPLGRFSANTLSLRLHNKDKRYTSTNTLSPFYEKIKVGTKMILYTSLLLPNGSFEELKMGSFYTDDWDVPMGSIIATVVCYDKMRYISKNPVPKLPVFYNTAIADLFTHLFLAMGLTTNDFVVDASLDTVIPFGWIPGPTVGDAFEELTKAGRCVIFINRLDQFVVMDPYKTGASIRTLNSGLDGNSQIKKVVLQQASYKTYTGVDLQFNSFKVGAKANLVGLYNQKLKAGSNEFKNVVFNTSPVTSISRIEINGPGATATKIMSGATSIDFLVNSVAEATDVDIIVYGFALESTAQSLSFSNDVEPTQSKQLSISSLLLQSSEVATQYGESLKKIIKDPNAYAKLSLRGDLTFDIGDVYTIDDPANSINLLPVYFTRIVLNYTGALSCEVDCTNYNAVH